MGMIGYLLRVSQPTLEEYLADSSLLEIQFSEMDLSDSHILDLDKEWDGVMFLLTGEKLGLGNGVLALTIMGGVPIDLEQDMGYGPALYLDPEQVKEVSIALENSTIETLHSRYHPEEMNTMGIYPTGWKEDDVSNLLATFENIQKFYSIASQNDQAIISFLC